jgi:hypothetical protein
MSVGQVSINIYATKKQANVMKDASDFVNRAKVEAEQPTAYAATATDKQVAAGFVKLSAANQDKLNSAQEYLAAAAWLSDRPSLAEVLLERGDLTRQDLARIIGESLVTGSTRGLSVNALWADTAVRLGHLSRDVATAHLKTVASDEKHLTIPDELLNKGELTVRQEQEIRDALRERIQRKSRTSGSGVGTTTMIDQLR